MWCGMYAPAVCSRPERVCAGRRGFRSSPAAEPKCTGPHGKKPPMLHLSHVCQHESHVQPSIPRVTSHQLMPRESVSRSRLSQWCSGVADASREIVVLQAAILAPSSCHCFEPCENALASWSGLSAMYVRHGGASRLALVPQLQLCVTVITDLFCG